MPSSKRNAPFVFHRHQAEIPEELGEGLCTSHGAQGPPEEAWTISERRIEGGRIDAPAGSDLRVRSSILEKVTLAEGRYSSLTFKNTRLVNCDLANLETRALTLLRVELIDCRLTGLRGGEVDAQHVLFSECDLRYAQLRFSRFHSAEFLASNLEEADLHGTDLTGARLRNCNLRQADMNKVKLVDADLRGSKVEGLDIKASDVRGAVVDPAQAMVFALLLGLRIE